MGSNAVSVRGNSGKSPVFMDVKTLSPKIDESITEIVDIRQIKVDIDLILPRGIEANEETSKLLQKPFEAVIKRYTTLIDRQLQQVLKIVVEKHKEDEAGENKNAYSEASSALSKANSYIKDLMNDFRIDVRKAAAKELSTPEKKVGAKEFMTIGNVSFKEMKIVKGAFGGEVNYTTGEDITKILKTSKGKWIYCVLLKAGNEALLAVDKKKPVKKADWSGRKKELSGSVKIYSGIMKPGGTTAEFRFVNPPKQELKKNLLKIAVGNSAEGFDPSQCSCGEPLTEMPSPTALKALPS